MRPPAHPSPAPARSDFDPPGHQDRQRAGLLGPLAAGQGVARSVLPPSGAPAARVLARPESAPVPRGRGWPAPGGKSPTSRCDKPQEKTRPASHDRETRRVFKSPRNLRGGQLFRDRAPTHAGRQALTRTPEEAIRPSPGRPGRHRGPARGPGNRGPGCSGPPATAGHTARDDGRRSPQEGNTAEGPPSGPLGRPDEPGFQPAPGVPSTCGKRSNMDLPQRTRHITEMTPRALPAGGQSAGDIPPV